MTEVNILKCEVRKNTGKSFSKLVRKEGNIPCIIYGDKKDPIAININSHVIMLCVLQQQVPLPLPCFNFAQIAIPSFIPTIY